MTIRLFWRMVAHNVTTTVAYRAAFFAMMVTTVIQPIVSLLVLLTIQEEGAQLPFDRSQLITYYTLLGLVSMLTACWVGLYLGDGIREGALSDTLIRPAPYIFHYATNNIGEKIVKLPLLLPIIIVIAMVFRGDLRLTADPLRWISFLVALPLAAATAFLIDFVLGSFAFWVSDVSGLFRIKTLLGGLLGGQLVPLAFFPASATPFLEAQPFRYTLSFPLELLASNLAPDAVVRGFVWQVGYFIVLWAIYRVLWHYGLRSYEATGR